MILQGWVRLRQEQPQAKGSQGGDLATQQVPSAEGARAAPGRPQMGRRV